MHMYQPNRPAPSFPKNNPPPRLNLRFQRKYLQTTDVGILPILVICVNTNLDEERSKLSTESKEY